MLITSVWNGGKSVKNINAYLKYRAIAYIANVETAPRITLNLIAKIIYYNFRFSKNIFKIHLLFRALCCLGVILLLILKMLFNKEQKRCCYIIQCYIIHEFFAHTVPISWAVQGNHQLYWSSKGRGWCLCLCCWLVGAKYSWCELCLSWR